MGDRTPGEGSGGPTRRVHRRTSVYDDDALFSGCVLGLKVDMVKSPINSNGWVAIEPSWAKHSYPQNQTHCFGPLFDDAEGSRSGGPVRSSFYLHDFIPPRVKLD